MDYIKQLNALWRWRELHDISHAQLDIYMAILDIFNRAFWARELAVPNRIIMCKAEISDRKQLAAERQALVELGLISYTPGRAKQAGTYSVTVLYTDAPAADHEAAAEFTPIDKTENIIHKTKTETKTKTKTKTEPSDSAAQQIFEMYNELCPTLPKAEKLTPKRIAAIRDRLRAFSVTEIEEAFTKAERSDFLRGYKKDWRANLDWLIGSDGNLLKVLEGNYDNNIAPLTDNTYTDMAPTENTAEFEQRFMEAYGGG